MSEIEKMYENCGIEPQYWCSYQDTYCPIIDIGKFNSKCAKTEVTKDCDVRSHIAQLPPFTAEKQLSLFQWVCKKFNEIYICHTNFEEAQSWEIVYKVSVHRNSFEECLCAFINLFWQDLTEEEKTSIKNILEM